MSFNTLSKSCAATFLALMFIVASAYPQMSESEKKSWYIDEIKKKDTGPKESMRDFYVARLAEMDDGVQDPEVLNLLLDLIENDENDWIRLEAVGEIHHLQIPPEMLPKVTAALEKCRADKRVNFQVLASQSLVEIAKKNKKTDLVSVKALARIANGEEKWKWDMMIPQHNLNTTILDPATKKEVPFVEFFKTKMRLNAISGLSRSGDDFSKKVIADLRKDGDKNVREAAESQSAAQ